ADFRPKRLKEYQVPEKLRSEVRRQIQELLEMGLIKISNSPMASPLICALKGPGGREGIRLVMDYRFLNKYTVSDALGPPDIGSAMQRIGNAKFISTFDGKSSYWAIPLKEEDQWLTAFVCEGQTYEWTRAAFGLKNSGSAFLRMIERVLHPVRDFVESFVDDMAVHTETTWDMHLEHIKAFLETVRRSGLTLSLKKVSLAQPEVRFCGFFVGSGGRRIDPDRLASIRGLKVPKSKKEVRSVLGVFSWFREFVPFYSDLAHPLIDLTKSAVPNKIPWNSRHQQAFDNLKEALSEAANRALSIIDWRLPFEIATDASNLAVAGVLFQTSSEGKPCPISFFSKKLTDAQRNWPVIEREALGVLTGLQKFKTWIFGYRIVAYCDHNPLAYLTDSASKSPRLLRWALALQSYDLEFRYSAGNSALMGVPDCLSRMGPDVGEGGRWASAHQVT
ncbi:MAG TPA: reverse transcriptase family protein, partial [Methylomicrobium sp.]|nr:reverse transcriptase family protein [Methylomicrobium sp.]